MTINEEIPDAFLKGFDSNVPFVKLFANRDRASISRVYICNDFTKEVEMDD